jgi:hypothetical protein
MINVFKINSTALSTCNCQHIKEMMNQLNQIMQASPVALQNYTIYHNHNVVSKWLTD